MLMQGTAGLLALAVFFVPVDDLPFLDCWLDCQRLLRNTGYPEVYGGSVGGREMVQALVRACGRDVLVRGTC